MLVLSRQRDEAIMLGNNIEVVVVDIRGDKVRLGINAPKSVSIYRKEVYVALKKSGQLVTEETPPIEDELAAWKQYAHYCRSCAHSGESTVLDFKVWKQRYEASLLGVARRATAP